MDSVFTDRIDTEEEVLMSKGDWRRPAQISDEELEERWNKIFSKKQEESEVKADETETEQSEGQ